MILLQLVATNVNKISIRCPDGYAIKINIFTNVNKEMVFKYLDLFYLFNNGNNTHFYDFFILCIDILYMFAYLFVYLVT